MGIDMKKKLIIFSLILFIAASSLSCNNHRIHLQAYVPTIINIFTTPEDELNVTFNNEDAYYNLSNLQGTTSNYHDAIFFNLYMI
ncbi:MAG: hypothetical protein PQJ49_04020 [Sphaerochaetaceae bacterium]|nr:hypothetical protein [Sphaerochaetaceae bacterium]MDC7237404.1 hypothetical protein [Sphaerochaetaceae bacterium]MDC7249066.1 hypothetical protein [Sphaerochaetaceae bacterium]